MGSTSRVTDFSHRGEFYDSQTPLMEGLDALRSLLAEPDSSKKGGFDAAAPSPYEEGRPCPVPPALVAR
jgi:hypothetical protein